MGNPYENHYMLHSSLRKLAIKSSVVTKLVGNKQYQKMNQDGYQQEE